MAVGGWPRASWQMPILKGLAAGIPLGRLARNSGSRKPGWSPSRVSPSRGGDGCTGDTSASRWPGQFWCWCSGSGHTGIAFAQGEPPQGGGGHRASPQPTPPYRGAASSCVQLQRGLFPDVRGGRRRGARRGPAVAAGRRFHPQPPKFGNRRLHIWFRSQLFPEPSRWR